jgi:hypothetical protein
MSSATSAIALTEGDVEPNADLAHCFLRLANLPNFALDRLSRYEATLWRLLKLSTITKGLRGKQGMWSWRRCVIVIHAKF